MSALILPFRRPRLVQCADGAFEAVFIAARRMGYPDHLALRAARQARNDVLNQKGTNAMIISVMKAQLRLAAKQVPA